MKTLELQSVVYQEGKYFVAQSLGVDVSSFGATEVEALANLKEALELYFEDTPTPEVGKVKDPTVHTLRLQNA